MSGDGLFIKRRCISFCKSCPRKRKWSPEEAVSRLVLAKWQVQAYNVQPPLRRTTAERTGWAVECYGRLLWRQPTMVEDEAAQCNQPLNQQIAVLPPLTVLQQHLSRPTKPCRCPARHSAHNFTVSLAEALLSSILSTSHRYNYSSCLLAFWASPVSCRSPRRSWSGKRSTLPEMVPD